MLFQPPPRIIRAEFRAALGPRGGLNSSARAPNQTLDKLSVDPGVGLSEDTRQALGELRRCLDDLHFEQSSGAPLNGQFFPLQRPSSPDDSYYKTEEGHKYDAFRPVVNAKRRLLFAVKSGDLERVRQALEAYDQAEAALRSKNEGRAPTQEEIDKFAGVIRTDRRFQAFMQEKESKLANGADYLNAVNALSFEASRTQFLEEMAQKVPEPIPQAPAPEGNQPRQQNQLNGPAAQSGGHSLQA